MSWVANALSYWMELTQLEVSSGMVSKNGEQFREQNKDGI